MNRRQFETSRIKGLADRVVLPNRNLPAEKTDPAPLFRGVGLAYKGDGKWVLGFAPLGTEDFEWVTDLSFEDVFTILKEHEKHFVRQSDEAIFGV